MYLQQQLPNRLSYLVTQTQILPYHISKVIYWVLSCECFEARVGIQSKAVLFPCLESMNVTSK